MLPYKSPVAWRYRLNPCDYLYFAHHRLLRRRGEMGNMPCMTAELEGDLDPAELEAAIQRVMEVHPVLQSRARIERLPGRPAWIADQRMDRPALVVHDLRNRADWRDEARRLLETQFSAGWDMAQSPQIRVELYRGPQSSSMLCLRWPHGLMDAEGAQWTMHEIDRLGATSGSQPPAGLLPDERLLDPLADESWWRKLRLFQRGRRRYCVHESTRVAELAEGSPRDGHWRFLHRRWRGPQWDELRASGARWCPSGPARFSRFLAGCVLRALARLYAERGVASDAWLITLPMRVRGISAARPLQGNYLVSATLCGRRAVMDHRQRLYDELEAQVRSFLDDGGDRANWALIWMAAKMREWQYEWLLSRPSTLQPYASGFSFYGEIDPPLRSLLGARVTNFWGSAAMAAPPGWNPAFARFADSLNLSLTWLEGYHTRATAERYAALIESELFES